MRRVRKATGIWRGLCALLKSIVSIIFSVTISELTYNVSSGMLNPTQLNSAIAIAVVLLNHRLAASQGHLTIEFLEGIVQSTTIQRPTLAVNKFNLYWMIVIVVFINKKPSCR